MIWAAIAIVACALLCFIIIKKIEKTNELIRSQCLDIFNLKQTVDEFKKDHAYLTIEWGKELKMNILSLQADLFRNKKETPIKKIVGKPMAEATKRKHSERMKEYWAQKKKEEGEKVKPSSFFKFQTATAPEAGSNDIK